MKSIYIISGDERFLIRKEIERIVHNNPQAEAETLDDISPSELAEKIFLPSLFSPQKVFIIHDFDFSECDENLISALINIPPEVVLVFITPRHVDRRTKEFKTLEKTIEIIECKKIPEWEEDKLISWIIAQANAFGKTISRGCAELLIEYVGFELGLLASEIEKLSVYLLDRKEIKTEDIEKIVPRTGYDAFTLSSALGEKNRKKSYEALQKLFMDREDPVELLGLLSSQFRNLYKAKLLKWRKLNNFQAAKILKANPYYIGKLMAYSDNFKEGELERSVDALCRTDIRLKSGFNPNVELSLLLLELIGEKG